MLKSFNSKILLFSFLASGGLPWGIPVHPQHQGYEGWYPTLTQHWLLCPTSVLVHCCTPFLWNRIFRSRWATNYFCPTLCTQHERSWKRKKTYLLHLCSTQVIHTIRDTPPNPSGLLALSTDSSHCYLAYPGIRIAINMCEMLVTILNAFDASDDTLSILWYHPMLQWWIW